MENITVRKADLLAKIRANRQEHREIFEEALEGYKAEALRNLEDHIDRLKRGKLRHVYIAMPVPQDHTSDYDRVIAMLEMDVSDEVELSEGEFARYVLDDWQWQDQFLTTASNYSRKAFGKGQFRSPDFAGQPPRPLDKPTKRPRKR